jgi:hypothetical protein
MKSQKKAEISGIFLSFLFRRKFIVLLEKNVPLSFSLLLTLDSPRRQMQVAAQDQANRAAFNWRKYNKSINVFVPNLFTIGCPRIWSRIGCLLGLLPPPPIPPICLLLFQIGTMHFL